MATVLKRSVWALTAAAAVTLAVRAGLPAQADSQVLGFSTPTVVDPYRPGYEPDLAIDPNTKAGKGATYTTTPFGFSTTQSFVYRSDDQRQSFHLTEGNVLGKPTNCIGGGDTELKIDPVNGALYFVDLQGLTNFSTSTSPDQGATWTTTCTGVNGTGVDRQWLGLDSNGGKDAVVNGNGRLYLDYDNTKQSTTQPGGNQLVMNESLDGVHFGGQCQAAGVPCPAPAAVISADEGIPGNIVVDNVPGSAYQHRVYAIHTSAASNSVIVSYCSGAKGDNTAAMVAADCTDPTQTAASGVNKNWTDTAPRAAGKYLTGNLFASIAIDSVGNLYVVWSEYPVDSSGTENGPGVIMLAVSSDGAQHWSAPVAVSPASLGNNVMPWIAAGDPGRIDIAWYGAPQVKNDTGVYGPDSLDKGTWNVYLAQSLNATSAQPTFTVAQVSDHQTKFGTISTQGLGGSPDRSLGDFMQVQVGTQGEAVISYVDDTSADRNPDLCGCGQTPPEAAGPIMIAAQNSGPSLYNSVGTLSGLPSAAVGSVTDATGDAFLYQGGSKTAAPSALDITAVSVAQADAMHLTVTMTTADTNLAQDLAFSPSLGGPVGEWIVRWAAPAPAATPGDGNIFYVGMESNQGGTPVFYMGTTGAIETTHTKYFVYPTTASIPGKIAGNSIIWTVPLGTSGGPTSTGGMFGITGFTATQLTPSPATVVAPPNGGTAGDENIPNTIDLSPPFSFQPGSSTGSSSSSGGSSGAGSSSSSSSSSSGAASSGGSSGTSSGGSSSSSGSSSGAASSSSSSSGAGGSSGGTSSGASSGNGGSGGGALGGATLLPLLLGAALRRKRRV